MRVTGVQCSRRSSSSASWPLTSSSPAPMSKSSWLARARRPSPLSPGPSGARLTYPVYSDRNRELSIATRSSENDDAGVEFEIEREEGESSTSRTMTTTLEPPPSSSSPSSTYPHLGPASLAALEALEWNKLCSYVARFASTSAGREAARGGSGNSENSGNRVGGLELGSTRERSLELAALTSAAAFMEGELGRELDFAGTSTTRARSAAQRAERGGLLTGAELVAVASLAAGSVRLSASILAAASAAGEGDDARSAAEGVQRKWRKPPRENEGRKGKKEQPLTGAETLRPLSTLASSLNRPPLRDLAAKLFACLDDDGYVRDSASEGLRAARVKLRTAEARARSAVKGRGGGGGGGGDNNSGGGGSAAERGGRYCVALPDGAPPPRGAVLLGGGGGVRYWEPASLVPINNALAAARAEASAAEDAARWSLSSLAAGSSADLEQAFELVLAADLAAARARYGVWIDGTMASCHDLAEREEEAKRGGRKRGGGGGGSSGKNSSSDGDESPSTAPSSSCPFSVELRDLRQPLLLGAHLLARDAEAAAARRRRAAGGGGGGNNSSGSIGGASAAAAANRASTAASAAAALAAAGVSAVSSTHFSSPSSSEQKTKKKGEHRVPPPPVPVDILVPSRARVVVVTGPNTGGKTAALKAVGLCALCAAAGVPLPASPTSTSCSSSSSSTARMPWFSRVLADIGDAQSLSASLSTFSGHLARVSAARREAASARAQAALEGGGKFETGNGDDALFLIDELGTGTDPREGAALGAALLRKLAGGDAEALFEKKKANQKWHAGGVGLTLATTHHASLAALKAQDAAEMLRLKKKNESEENAAAAVVESRFENAAADFDVTSLSPTRKLLWGVPGKSAALDVAASLGLDAGVVAAARERLSENTGLSALIEAGVVGSLSSTNAPSSLDAAVADVEAARAAAARDRRLAAEARASAADKRAAAEELLRRAEEASAAAALEAASAVSAAVRKGKLALRDASRSKSSEKRAEQRKKREVEEKQAAENAAAEAEAARLALLAVQGPWKPRVGEAVFVKKLSARGTISSVHEGGRVLGVKLGGVGLMAMTTKVSVDDVERVAVDESSSSFKKNSGKGNKTFKAQMTSKWSKKM